MHILASFGHHWQTAWFHAVLPSVVYNLQSLEVLCLSYTQTLYHLSCLIHTLLNLVPVTAMSPPKSPTRELEEGAERHLSTSSSVEVVSESSEESTSHMTELVQERIAKLGLRQGISPDISSEKNIPFWYICYDKPTTLQNYTFTRSLIRPVVSVPPCRIHHSTPVSHL